MTALQLTIITVLLEHYEALFSPVLQHLAHGVVVHRCRFSPLGTSAEISAHALSPRTMGTGSVILHRIMNLSPVVLKVTAQGFRLLIPQLPEYLPHIIDVKMLTDCPCQ